jgi:hypothetical protein
LDTERLVAPLISIVQIYKTRMDMMERMYTERIDTLEAEFHIMIETLQEELRVLRGSS